MFRLLAGLAALVIAVGALGTASCKLWLNCHIGEGVPDAQPSPNADRASLPDGFAERTVGTGLVEPTDFALRPGSDLPYVTDNGHRQYEEINVVRRGINAGWPCYEGRVRALVYRDTSFSYSRGELRRIDYLG